MTRQEMEVSAGPSLEPREKQTLLFLATAIFYVYRKAGAFIGLSKQEMARHICRVVNQARRGVPKVSEKNVPPVSEAKPFAKVIFKKLHKRYGGDLKQHLLEETPEVETFLVFCLQKNSRKLFLKMESFGGSRRTEGVLYWSMICFSGLFLIPFNIIALVAITLGLVLCL